MDVDETAVVEAIGRIEATRPLHLILVGGAENKQGAFPCDSLSIGRDSDRDIVVDDDAASRLHSELILKEGRVFLLEKGSRNGSFVNGVPVESNEPALLMAGDVVRIGNSLFCVQQLDACWEEGHPTGPFVGGPSIANTLRAVSLISKTELSVLIQGETGTGKDVIARMIHERSQRRGRFVPVNCAALPKHLVESELFGHVRGAFTGASQAKRGLFAAADHGTIFLDEVGDLPIDTQASLLRALEEKKVRPVGGDQEVPVDIRVISATNQELDANVFRSDLYARLNGLNIQLKPLRERKEDIPILVSFLLERVDHGNLSLSENALEALLVNDWPLNVRGLNNVLHAAALAASSESRSQIELTDLPKTLQLEILLARSKSKEKRDEPQRRVSSKELKPLMLRAMEEHRGNVKNASEHIGISRSHAYRLLKQWNVDPSEFRVDSDVS